MNTFPVLTRDEPASMTLPLIFQKNSTRYDKMQARHSGPPIVTAAAGPSADNGE
jgi:hypothetical protein